MIGHHWLSGCNAAPHQQAALDLGRRFEQNWANVTTVPRHMHPVPGRIIVEDPAFAHFPIRRDAMKSIIVGLVAASLTGAAANVAYAQDSTVIHKESADGERSKTVVKHDDGSKTVIKRRGDRVKKVHTDANGDKTIVKKSTY
jgi:hypothetical protein